MSAAAEKNKPKLIAHGSHNNTRKMYPETYNRSTLSVEDFTVWTEQHYLEDCLYCGNPATSVDHIVPLSRGGDHELHNLRMICLRCNYAKRELTHDEFRLWLISVYENLKAAGELSVQPPVKEGTK